MAEERKTFVEAGLDWSWFTRLIDHGDGSVTILKHWRVHNQAKRTQEEQTAKMNESFWPLWDKRKTDQIALAYYLPNLVRWAKIRNPAKILNYGYQDRDLMRLVG